MKLLLALFFGLVAQASVAQCVSLPELRALAQKSRRERTDFLTARGFAHLDSAKSGSRFWQWRQATSQTQIDVLIDANDKTGKSVVVFIMVKAADACAQQLRRELAALGLRQDAEFTTGQRVVRYYAGPDCYLRLLTGYAHRGELRRYYVFFPSRAAYLLSLRAKA
jgi:hypothetical protein